MAYEDRQRDDRQGNQGQRRDNRSYSRDDRPRRDDRDNRSYNRDDRPRRDDRDRRDNRSYSRDDRDRRDNRSYNRDDRGRQDNRSYNRDDRPRRDDRDNRSYNRDDRPRRDDRDNRSYNRDDRGRQDNRSYNRDDRDRRDNRSYNRDDRDRRDNRSYNRDDRPRRDDRDKRSYNRDDRPRRDDRDRRDNRSYNRDDRPRRDDRDQAPRFAGQRSDGRNTRRDNDKFGQKRQKPHQAEYKSADPNEPIIPAGVSADELGAEALRALDTLSGANREIVARHLVMAGQVLDVDPALAYDHAQAAVKRAGRVDVVREAAALTAYATGRYEEALREVRALRRMRGDESLRAIEADSERGLGRPEKALEVIAETDTSKLSLAEQVEVILVAAGARADLGENELGLVIIEDALAKIPDDGTEEVRSRLMSMQADLLRVLDREEEADAVEAAMPVADDPMEITDLSEILEGDVDHTRTPLRGSDKPLTEVFDALVLDLDGVCFEGTNPIDYASEVLTQVDAEGTKLSYATNNASRSAEQIAEKLRGFDIPVEEKHIMTSAMDCMFLLKDNLEEGATVLVIGTDSLYNLVVEAGFTAVRTAEGDVDAVVQGYGPEVGWAELSEAAYALNKGARFYATNLDTSLPTERGMALGNGSLVAAVSRATNRRAEATGKPNPEIMHHAAATVEAQNPLGVGDRLETDTAAAFNANMPSLHVLTGVSSASDVVRAKRGERPAYLALDLRGLQETHPQPKHHRDGTWTAGVSQPVKFTRWGHMVVDGVELRPDGDPVKINLDTYRALAAAGWEVTDDGRKPRVPELIVVENEDMEGIIREPNYEIAEEAEAAAEGEDEVVAEIDAETEAEVADVDDAEADVDAEVVAEAEAEVVAEADVEKEAEVADATEEEESADADATEEEEPADAEVKDAEADE